LDYYTVVNGVVQDCQVTENTGMHANGLTFYVGCKNILIERNIVRDGNVGITLHTGENMIIRNNIIEGGRSGAPAVGLWAGQPFSQIVMTNNVFRYHGQGGNDPTMGIYGGNQGAKGYAIVNNIIDGISGNVLLKADLHHNLFTRLGPGMTLAQLGDNRLVQNLDEISVDAPGEDYRPATDSPAIDAGINLAKLNAYDIEGVPRPQGKAVDIGPYEVIPSGTDLKSKRRLIDPHDFKFTFAGYEIAPPPEFKVTYQLRFKRREGAKTIVKKGIDLTGEGGGQVKHRPTRGGYVAHWYNPGHWLEWTVEVAEAGPYEVVIEHASQTAAKRKVILNGQPVGGLQEFAFPLTGDWTTWGKTGLDKPLMLEQGSNKIRFDHVQGHLNFKSLEFIPVVLEKGN
jgi:parallel beta-helix repeat protein